MTCTRRKNKIFRRRIWQWSDGSSLSSKHRKTNNVLGALLTWKKVLSATIVIICTIIVGGFHISEPLHKIRYWNERSYTFGILRKKCRSKNVNKLTCKWYASLNMPLVASKRHGVGERARTYAPSPLSALPHKLTWKKNRCLRYAMATITSKVCFVYTES